MRRLALFVLACAALVGGCGGTPTSPTVVVPPTVTEVFSGTISPFSVSPTDSVRFHNFTVAQAGTVTIDLTSAGPPATITIGLGVGTPTTDGVCAIPNGNGFQVTASSTPQLTGTASAGLACIAVYDVGNMLADVNYSVTVVHP